MKQRAAERNINVALSRGDPPYENYEKKQPANSFLNALAKFCRCGTSLYDVTYRAGRLRGVFNDVDR